MGVGELNTEDKTKNPAALLREFVILLSKDIKALQQQANTMQSQIDVIARDLRALQATKKSK
jgi:hypothetical protein